MREQQVKITTLQRSLERYKSYDEMSRKVIPELKVLYPSVTALSTSHTIETAVDSMKIDTIALVTLKFTRHPKNDEKEKTSTWLQARVRARKPQLIVEE